MQRQGALRGLRSQFMLLIYVFEFMQGNDTGALMHLRSGLDILRRKQAGPSTNGSGVLPWIDSGVIMNDIFYVFCVLDVQATIWARSRVISVPSNNNEPGRPP